MGKKDKKKSGKGAEKTAAKTEKKATLKLKKELRAKGEEDIEKIISEIHEYDRQRLEVIEELCPPPTPRSSFTLNAHPDKDELILYGGEYCNGKKTFLYGDLFFYNIKKDSWTLVKIPNCPPPRCSHQAVALQQGGGQLWVFGGEFASPTQSQFHHYRDLWVLHLQTRKWEKITATGGPSARSGHRMVASKKQLIVFGGFSDNNRDCKYFNDAFAFNLDTYKWTRLECGGRGPCPRSGCQMAALSDGRIVVYGGYSKEIVKKDVERGVVHANMFLLQQEKNDQTGVKWRWSTLKQSGMRPSPRCGFSLVPIPGGSGNRVFLFGGVFDTEEDEESLCGTFFDELYLLDLEKGNWSAVKLTGLDAAKKKPRRNKTKADGAESTDGIVDDDDDGDEDGAAAIDALELHEGSAVGAITNTQSVKTYDDGIFSVTIGEQSTTIRATDDVSNNGANSEPGPSYATDVNTPHSRMNCGLSIKHGALYLYGGIYEDGDRSITLSDFYKLDIHRLDQWHTIVKCNIEQQEWIDSSSDSSMDGDDDDDSEDDDDVGDDGADQASCMVQEDAVAKSDFDKVEEKEDLIESMDTK